MTSTLAETAGTCLSAVIVDSYPKRVPGASCAGAVSNQRVLGIGNAACYETHLFDYPRVNKQKQNRNTTNEPLANLLASML